MDTYETVIPRTKSIRLLGREMEVRPLSIRRAVQLGRLIADAAKGPEGGLAAPASDAEALLALLERLDCQKLAKAIVLMTGEELSPQEAARADRMGLAEFSRLVRAVCETNDFAETAANFMAALEAGKRQGTPSPAR